jgi:indole-3-glycerol phosphate synthase
VVVNEQGIHDRLAVIVEAKVGEVERLRPSSAALRAEAEGAPAARRFGAALRSETEVRLLAEIKRRSPSAGLIRSDVETTDVARAYEAGGAAALSVLTDEEFFGGSLEALRRVRRAVALPLLRKDFVLDEVQVWEARAAGADAILLIVRILDDPRLAALRDLALELGMAALVEVHDARELDRALTVGADLIGINNRDLSTFRTDLALSLQLAAGVEPEVTLIAESGIRSPDDVVALGAVGMDAILVGESLMRQADLRAAAAKLVGHPRAARARRG